MKWITIVLALGGLCLTTEVEAQRVVAPVAPTVAHTEVRHGTTVSDNYHWLREKSNQEVIRYLEAENAYTAAMTKGLMPFADALYNEMAKGHKFVGVGSTTVSDDDQLLAYTVDFTGFRQYSLQVKDLRTGQILPDTVARVTSVEWAADNKTLFLTTEDEVTKRSDKLWRHVLGSEKPTQLYNETNELYDIELERTRDKKYEVVEISSKDTTEVRYLAADRAAEEFRVFLPREKGHRYYVDHREGEFYIRTNKGAKDFQVVTAAENHINPQNWKEFIPHQPGRLIEDIELFKSFAVSVEKSEALNRMRVFYFEKREWASVPFPEPVYSASPGETPDYNSETFRYNYQSFITPSSVYDYDVRSGQSKLLKRQEVLGGYDPSQYTSERLWATARDGVKVPISIVYKKGLVRDGKAPLFLYAYGSYGIGMPAAFSSQRLSLLNRGMTYAIAHIRGGDEMGETWREDGMLMKKKNTFTDFIDSAEYLVHEKWTSSDRLVIEGGSAGGLLMGAVVNMRPDLFKAVHAAVPFVDVMNTMMDATLPLTVGEYLEWGNPNEQAAYDYMKTYSPYDNLEMRAYPAMLVTTSLNDSQVMYWEPTKYVARLRRLKTDSNPLLLKTKMEPAGHGGASGRYDRLKDTAFEYAWVMSQVGITQ